MTWDDVDAASVARRIANLQDMVRAAEDGSSALTQIARQIDQVEMSINESDEELLEVVGQLGRVNEQLDQISERHLQAEAQIENRTLSEETVADLGARFRAIAPNLLLSNIDQVTKDASATLDAELMTLQKQTSRAEEDLSLIHI